MPKKDRRRVGRDRVRQRAQDNHSSGGGGATTLLLPDGVEQYKPQKGSNMFDIIPYEVSIDGHPQAKKGKLWYERTYFAHRNIGPENKMVVCPQRTFGDPCPVCEEQQRMKADEDADEAMEKSLRAKKRQCFNVISKGKKAKGDIEVFEFSHYNFGRALDEEITVGPEENADFMELQDGLTVEARFSEETMEKNTYLECSRIDFHQRKKDYPEDILDEVVDLDKAIANKTMSYDELESLFNGPKRSKTKDEPAEEKEPKDDDTKDKEIPKGHIACEACEGSGKNSRGRTCRICDGDGYVKDEDGDPIEPEVVPKEDEPPKEKEKPADDGGGDGWGGDDDWD